MPWFRVRMEVYNEVEADDEVAAMERAASLIQRRETGWLQIEPKEAREIDPPRMAPTEEDG